MVRLGWGQCYSNSQDILCSAHTKYKFTLVLVHLFQKQEQDSIQFLFWFSLISAGIVRGSLDVEPLNWLAVIFSGCQWMELSKQWMSVDVSGWNFLPAYCQWMAVDGSGWQWMAVDGSGWQWMCNCHLCNSSRPTACRLVVTAASYKVGTSYINKPTDKCSLQKCSCGSWRELQHNILTISWSVCMNTPYWSLVSFSRTQLPRSNIQKLSAC